MIRHSDNTSESWKSLNWKKFRKDLFRLQCRVFKAIRAGNKRKALSLQKLILKSSSARFLAIRQVSQLNAGKKTAGIDGKKSINFDERFELSDLLKTSVNIWKHQGLRSIPIPKKDGSTRMLKIPTISDRAWQCLAKYAIEPAHEATFHAKSYGFRPGRSAHDAQKVLFNNLNSQANGINKRVIELDIEKCFDRINHTTIMENLLAPKGIKSGIFRCLQAGTNPEFPLQGTPQGGVISPLLANIALNGIESIHRLKSHGNLLEPSIRYADDMVIILRPEDDATEILDKINEFLAARGMKLSEKKTRITAATDGFDFLGWHFKVQSNGKFRCTPSVDNYKKLRRVTDAWKGYTAAYKDWAKHPDKYLGEPKIPKYKHKERGRNVVVYPIDAISKPALNKGIVKLSQTNIEFPTHAANVDQVRIVPKLDHYVIEVIYTVEDAPKTRSEYIAGVDLGLNNLMAITSNQPGVKPLLVNGRPLKSINQFFNKRVAASQSIKAYRQIKALNGKRDRRIDNYLHTVSRRVIDWCQINNIGHLIIGNNSLWKQDINIGKKNNQDFTKIPHSKLINLLTYKAELAGIDVTVTEESYTSKASALDSDELPKYGDKKETKLIFSGKRVKRGLYKTSTGKTINADTNGSLNIARKVIPNFMDGIVGLPFIPVVLAIWTLVYKRYCLVLTIFG